MKEIIKPDNLIAGVQVPLLTQRVGFEPGTYKRGDLLQYDTANKNVSKCNEISKVFGIVTDNSVVDTAGAKASVYISGIFNLNSMEIDPSIDRDLLRLEARKLNIYFAEER